MTGQLSEQELMAAHGMDKHERRQYEGGEGCSCGKEFGHCIRAGLSCLTHRAIWNSGVPGRCEIGRALYGIPTGEHDKPHQHTPSDPEPGCEYCEEAAK